MSLHLEAAISYAAREACHGMSLHLEAAISYAASQVCAAIFDTPRGAYARIWPVPRTTNLRVVRSSQPIGPKA